MRTLRWLSLTAVFSAALACWRATPGASLAHAQAAPAPAAEIQVPSAPPAPPVQAAPAAPSYPAAPAAPVYPPPPPGYYAPPPVDPAQHSAVLAELANIDARVAAVRAERGRSGLGGPIALMASGYGTALIFSIVGLVHWGIAEDIEKGRYLDHGDYNFNEYDRNGDGVINNDDERRARRGARTFAAISFIGVGVGIGGSVFLARRLAARRTYDPELQSLRRRRLELLRQLRYGGALSQGGMQLSLSGRF